MLDNALLKEPVSSLGNMSEAGGARATSSVENRVVPVLDEHGAILPYTCSVLDGVGKFVVSLRAK
jgi:hypothetical protein